MSLRGGLLYCLLLLPGEAAAGKVLDSSVQHEAGVYRLSVSASIDAPLATVYRVITDYDNLAAISPSIIASHSVATDDPRIHRVHSVIRVCILVFCKRVVQLQRVEQVDSRTIEAVMLPDGSDFRHGVARWQFTEAAGTTVLVFFEELEPDFWVPPVIGPWLIERELVREVAQTVEHIEQLDRYPEEQGKVRSD